MRHLVAAVVAVVVLGGCADDPTPRFEADPSESPSESASTTPDVREPWEEKSDEGAIAFVEHWVDEFNAMRASGDTSTLADLSSSRCDSCSSSLEYAEEIYGAGGSLETDGWKVLSVSAPAKSGSSTPVLGVRIDRAPQLLRESTNAEPERFAGGPADYTAYLRWANGQWLMERLDLA